MSDVEAPVQPNLASNNMELLNSLLNQPNRPKCITVLSPNLETGTTWYFLFLSTSLDFFFFENCMHRLSSFLYASLVIFFFLIKILI